MARNHPLSHRGGVEGETDLGWDASGVADSKRAQGEFHHIRACIAGQRAARSAEIAEQGSEAMAQITNIRLDQYFLIDALTDIIRTAQSFEREP